MAVGMAVAAVQASLQAPIGVSGKAACMSEFEGANSGPTIASGKRAVLQKMEATYTVRSGDTVVSIAQAWGTLSSNVLTSSRQVPDPYNMIPG